MQPTSCWFSMLQQLTVHSHGPCCPPGPPRSFQTELVPARFIFFLFLDCVFSGERPDAYSCWASCYSTLPVLSEAECLEPIFQVTYEGIKLRCIILFLWSLNSHCVNYVKIFHSLSSLRSKDQDTKGCEAQERENGEICQLDLVDQ